MEHEAGAARDKRSGARLLFPRQVMHAVAAQSLHQKVPGRVEAHIIQPLAGAAVAQQFRWIGICQPTEFKRFCRAELLADAGEQFCIPRRALAHHCVVERAVRQKQVAVMQGNGLVKNGVRLPAHALALLQWPRR